MLTLFRKGRSALSLVIGAIMLGIMAPHAVADTVTVSHQAITERMKTANVIRGQFTQEKTISIMTRPLQSSGHFTLHHKQGIWWHNDAPVPGDMIISDTGIVQRNASGAIQRIDSVQQPALRIMSDIIRQLVSGDWKQLSAQFTIDAQAQTSAWHATLTPTPGSLFERYANHIELKGQDFVTFIAIHEKSGDKTLINFSQLTSDVALKASEANAFAW